MAQHGFLDPKSKISIDFDLNQPSDQISETEDNREIFTNLREQYSIFLKKFSPMVKKWVITLTKAGEICDSNLLKKSIDLKSSIDEMESKLKPFEVALTSKKLKKVKEKVWLIEIRLLCVLENNYPQFWFKMHKFSICYSGQLMSIIRFQS